MLMVKKPIKRDALKKIPFIHAEGSERYQPVEHSKLADTIIKQIKDIGLNIKKDTWGVSNNHYSLFGEVVLHNVIENPEMEFTIGVRANNQRRFPITLVGGGNVFVCSNLMICGEVMMQRKHTINLDLDTSIRSGLDKCISMGGQLDRNVIRMKETKIIEPKVHQIMMKSAIDGIISYSHLKDVYKEWKTPSHSEFNPRTEWSLYNCYTEVIKKYNPIRQQKSVGELTNLFSNN
jgi:hypothetical protein